MKRIFIISSIILFTAVLAEAQTSRTPVTDPAIMVLKTYPNPATTYITFDLQKGYQKGLTITVFNFLGRKMVETPNVNEKTTLPLTDFNRGVYIYYLSDLAGKVIDTGKFQVSR